MGQARSIGNKRWGHLVPAAWGLLAGFACGFPDVTFSESAPEGGATSSDARSLVDPGVGVGAGQGSSSNASGASDPASASGDGEALNVGGPLGPSDASGGAGASSGTGADGASRSSASGSSSGGSGSSSGSSGSSSGGSGSSSGSSGSSSGGSSGSSGSSSGGSGSSSGGVNCNCSPSQLYPANVSCGAITVTLLNTGLVCNQTSGFLGNDPGCGHSGTFVTCSADLGLLLCSPTTSTVVQQCH